MAYPRTLREAVTDTVTTIARDDPAKWLLEQTDRYRGWHRGKCVACGWEQGIYRNQFGPISHEGNNCWALNLIRRIQLETRKQVEAAIRERDALAEAVRVAIRDLTNYADHIDDSGGSGGGQLRDSARYLQNVLYRAALDAESNQEGS